MLKKKFSLVTALIMMITLFVGQMPSAWAKVGFVADGYEIIDSAYGNGTYVVMAKKSSDYKSAKIYISTDGIHWTETFTSTNAQNSAAKESRQELTYWDSQNLFVAAVGNSIYTSSNGTSWTVNEDLYASSNMVVEAKDGLLVVAGKNKAKIATSLKSIDISSVDCYARDNDYASLIIIDSDSKIYFNSIWARSVVEKTDGVWSKTSNPYEATGQNVIDAKRVTGENKWLTLINGSTTLSVAVSGGDYSPKQFTPLLADGANKAVITAAGADEEALFFGTTNGKIYSISSSANLVATEDVPADAWTEISPADGTTAIAEKVTDINKINADTFLVTTATGVYSMTKTGTGYTYSDMLSYKTVEEAKITGVLPFANGIHLYGGTYSPDRKRYVAYGNDADGKGHIYYSNNGINWNTTGVGTETLTAGVEYDLSTAKNQIVWWPAEEVFVLNNSSNTLYQSVWYSKDGINWSYATNSFGRGGDIQVVGDYLYSSYYNSRQYINKYTKITEAPQQVNYRTGSDVIKSYCSAMALSDDANLLVLSCKGNDDNNKTYAYNFKTSTLKNLGGGMRDISWNNDLKKFVMVRNFDNVVYFISDAFSVSKIETPSTGILEAIETNGSNYLIGDSLGKLYLTDTNIGTSSVFKEVSASGMANTLPVTNIFKGADNEYFVTVSDGVESDLLIVSADGSTYSKVSELITPTSIKAGDSFRVSVKTENYTGTAAKLSMIVGIYTADGTKLLQTAAEDKTMAVDSEAYQTMDVTADKTIPEGAKVKVFLWDSVNGMKPVAGEAKSFF